MPILSECQLEPTQPLDHESCDILSDCAKAVLQLGLLYMELNDIVHVADRERLQAVLKV